MNRKLLLLLLILLLLVGAILGYGAYNVDRLVRKYQPEIEQALSESLFDKVELGKIEVSLWPTPAITFHSALLSSQKEGFGLRAGELVLYPRLLPLLKNEVSLSKGVLRGGEVFEVARAEGEQRNERSESTDSTSHDSQSLSVDEFIIEEIRIDRKLVGVQCPLVLQSASLNLELNDRAEPQRFAFDGLLKVAGENVKLAVEGSRGVRGEFRPRLQAIANGVELLIPDFKFDELPYFEASLVSQDASLVSLLPLVSCAGEEPPLTLLKGTLSGKASVSHDERLAVSGEFRVRDVGARVSGVQLSGVNGVLHLTEDEEGSSLNWDLSGDGGTLKTLASSGKISIGSGDGSADISIQDMKADSYLALFEPFVRPLTLEELKGAVKSTVSFRDWRATELRGDGVVRTFRSNYLGLSLATRNTVFQYQVDLREGGDKKVSLTTADFLVNGMASSLSGKWSLVDGLAASLSSPWIKLSELNSIATKLKFAVPRSVRGLDGKLRVENAKIRYSEGSLNIDGLVEGKEISGSLYQREIRDGRLSLAFRTAENGTSVRRLQLNALVDASQISFDGSGEFDSERVRISDSRATFARFGNARIEGRYTGGRLSGRVQSKELGLLALTPFFPEAFRNVRSGTLIETSLDIDSDLPIPSDARGGGDTQIRNLRIAKLNLLRLTLDKLGQLPLIGGSLVRPLSEDLKDELQEDETTFSRITFKQRLKGDKFYIHDLRADAVLYGVLGALAVRNNDTLEGEIVVELGPRIASVLVKRVRELAVLQRRRGVIAIPLLISGRVEDPRVKLDIDNTLLGTTQNFLNSLTGELLRELLDK